MSAPSPPSMPIATQDPVDWRLLVGVCVTAYLAVMVAVAGFACFCRKSRRAGQEQQFNSFDADVEEQSVFKARTVNRPKSWSHQQQSGDAGRDLNGIPMYIKMGFIRKVYTILATQLAVTVGTVVGFVYLSFEVVDGKPQADQITSFGKGVFSNSWIIFVALIPLIMIICAMHALKNRYPHNFIMLFLFTMIESVVLGFVVTFYYAAGFGDQILLAFAITLMIFLSLTVFTMQSKVDWSFLGPALFTSLFILVFWGWFTFWLFPIASFTYRKIISLAGALIMSLFIIYDTNNIMKHMGVDDYIIAAIELYLDVINLFQYLLMLLSASNR